MFSILLLRYDLYFGILRFLYVNNVMLFNFFLTKGLMSCYLQSGFVLLKLMSFVMSKKNLWVLKQLRLIKQYIHIYIITLWPDDLHINCFKKTKLKTAISYQLSKIDHLQLVKRILYGCNVKTRSQTPDKKDTKSNFTTKIIVHILKFIFYLKL